METTSLKLKEGELFECQKKILINGVLGIFVNILMCIGVFVGFEFKNVLLLVAMAYLILVGTMTMAIVKLYEHKGTEINKLTAYKTGFSLTIANVAMMSFGISFGGPWVIAMLFEYLF